MATTALDAPPRRTRLTGPLATGAVVGGLTLALHLRDPHVAGSWGVCPWLLLTGHYCPGCGGLRAVNDLTHGDLLGAASSNLLVVALVPVALVWWLRWTGRAWRGDEPAPRLTAAGRSRWPVVAAVVVMLVFTVLRNTATGSWLAP